MSKLDELESPIVQKNSGSLHPINQTKDYLLDLLSKIGFTEVNGPELKLRNSISIC